MSSIFVFLIKVYQHTLGLMVPRVCRFTPSCSVYAIEAIRIHGAVRGCARALWRVMRCNPWCSGGLDPVPPRDMISSGTNTKGEV